MLDSQLTDAEAAHAPLNIAAARRLRDELDKPPSLPLGDAIKRAAAETGSGTAWLNGLWHATRGPGKLTAAEYFYYKLYDGRHDGDAIARFVGKSQQTKMHVACSDPKWFAAAMDKLFFLSVMCGSGIPVPELLAVFDPKTQREHNKKIASTEGLRAFLARPENYPMFAKPIDGMYSVGTMSITDGSNGIVHLHGAGTVTVDEVIEYMMGVSEDGYILQRTLRPSVRLQELFGGGLSTLRMLVLLSDDGPRIESTVVKIPRIDNVADNYWRDGNMLGAVNLGSGCITRIVTGVGPALRTVQAHPDSGHNLIGERLPDWEAAKALVKRAAANLPGLRTQSWDIALTRFGPVALEVNWGGDLNLHQLAHNRGALSERYVTHLQSNGYRGVLP